MGPGKHPQHTRPDFGQEAVGGSLAKSTADFRATGACDAAQGIFRSVQFFCLQNDVQDFDTRWDQIPLRTKELPHGNVVEGLCKMKLQGSDQLQTVLALYNPEFNRDKVTPRCHKLRTTVRHHIDQTIRTRNFRARNERFETGALVKSNGRHVSAERRVGECFQWQATGQCSRGDSCVHGEASGNRRDHGERLEDDLRRGAGEPGT